MENSSNASTATSTNSNKYNLRLFFDCRKLNSHIMPARQIKADGSLGKVISNRQFISKGFNGCKFFSTIDLRSGYYHIMLTKEATEKTAFIIDEGKWIFHSLPFGINFGPSAFSYVLGKVLMPCTKFASNYLDDIMIFPCTWEEHLQHLEAAFKQLEAADLKIKCTKCEFFKTKVHYLGFFVDIITHVHINNNA